MALRSPVKISSVNNLSVARYAAGMGVDLMGFNLDHSSKSYVSPENFHAITGWVSGVKLIGELENANHELISQLTEAYTLDYLQVNYPCSLTPEDLGPLSLIIKITSNSISDIQHILKECNSLAAWFLIEPNESLHTECLTWIGQQSTNFPIILGKDVTAERIPGLLELGISSFALPGSEEIKTGYSEFDELADVLEILEVDD